MMTGPLAAKGCAGMHQLNWTALKKTILPELAPAGCEADRISAPAR